MPRSPWLRSAGASTTSKTVKTSSASIGCWRCTKQQGWRSCTLSSWSSWWSRRRRTLCRRSRAEEANRTETHWSQWKKGELLRDARGTRMMKARRRINTARPPKIVATRSAMRTATAPKIGRLARTGRTRREFSHALVPGRVLTTMWRSRRTRQGRATRREDAIARAARSRTLLRRRSRRKRNAGGEVRAARCESRPLRHARAQDNGCRMSGGTTAQTWISMWTRAKELSLEPAASRMLRNLPGAKMILTLTLRRNRSLTRAGSQV
mmetsp:Transcript_30923/g.75143  ORF Transcript_30923/g.75143 Transcript_30923/m.75143 type:complete len:266 (-) Transcript_30923:553-1350(-)